MADRGAYKTQQVMKHPRTLGQRIKALRLDLGFSQAVLGDMLRVPQQSVSSWESGTTKPTRAGITLLVRLFRVPEVALRTGVGFKIPEQPPGGFFGWITDGDILAAEEGTKKCLSLPNAVGGEAWEVLIGTGERKPLNREQALELVSKSLDQGSAVWVVVKPCSD